MTVKELRQGLRRGIFLIPFLAIHVFAIVAMYAEFYMEDSLSSEKYTGVMQVFLFFDQSPFWWVAGGICMFLMPLSALLLMGPEMDEGNYELLQMTPLSRWKIVLGKFFAIWSICLLTFSSLLPYMIVRYFVGGMDVWRNIAMALTVVSLSAIFCVGALAASSFETAMGKTGVMLLFTASAALAGGIPLAGSALSGGECGIFYHLNVIAFIFCYMTLGLVMARSRIRLLVHHYEVKPSWMVIGLLIFTPLVAGMATLITAGWIGGLGLAAMGVVAKYSDVSPKAAKWAPAPEMNIKVAASAPAWEPVLDADAPQASPLDDVYASTPVTTPDSSLQVEEPIENKPILIIPKVAPKESKPIIRYPKINKDKHDGWK